MSQLALTETRPPLYSGLGYEVRKADRSEVDWMIRQKHYLHGWPGVSVAVLGLYRDGTPVGVIVWSLPAVTTYARYGGLTWELARLWVADSEPTNTESWFIARAVRYVRRFHQDVVALVSYADPSQGHTGVIYRAANWESDGRQDDDRKMARFDYFLNGKSYSRRSQVPDLANVEKVRRVSKYRYVLRLK